MASGNDGGNQAVVEAEDAPADFLFLRQLGQGVTLRLSKPLDLPTNKSASNLLCTAPVAGLLFAATVDGFIVHQLGDIRSKLTSASKNSSPTLEPWISVHTIKDSALGARVTFLRVANDDQTLLAALDNGKIAGWQIKQLTPSSLSPVFVLNPPKEGLQVTELAANPAEKPELCAVLYIEESQRGLPGGSVALCNVQSGQWQGEVTPPEPHKTTALCWSVRGKQLALGLDNGDIVQMTPESQAKDRVSRPSQLDGSPYVESVLWLENHVFVTTYNQAASGDEIEHQYEVYTILREPKAGNKLTYVHFNDPAPPFGDTSRRGHRYASWLKSWEPLKHAIFIANTSSTDVGLIGCTTEGTSASAWQMLDLEDTSRPALPFSSVDKSSDTSPVGLCFDLTAKDNVDDPQAAARGEDGKGKLSPTPILLVYTTDGVLLAYHVINVSDGSGKYGGLIDTENADVASDPISADAPMQSSSSGQEASSSPQTLQSSSSTPTPATSAPAFGQSTSFGSPSASPSFGKPAQIGGSPSPFSAFATSQSAAPSSTFGGGFGAFASQSKGPSGFGSSDAGGSNVFSSSSNNSASGDQAKASNDASKPTGFGGFSASSGAFGAAGSTPSPFASMTANAPSSSQSAFAASKPQSSTQGSAFGQSSAISSPFGNPPAFGAPSAFGQAAGAEQKSAFSSTPTSGFGKPSAFGFGSGTSSPFSASTPSSKSPSSASSDTAAPAPPTSAFSAFSSKYSPTGFSFASATGKDEPPGDSIFGAGGQLSRSEASKPIFGTAPPPSSSAFSFGKPETEKGESETGSALSIESAGKELQNESDKPSGAAESLSFGGFSELLNETTASKKATDKEEMAKPIKDFLAGDTNKDLSEPGSSAVESPLSNRDGEGTVEATEAEADGASKSSNKLPSPVSPADAALPLPLAQTKLEQKSERAQSQPEITAESEDLKPEIKSEVNEAAAKTNTTSEVQDSKALSTSVAKSREEEESFDRPNDDFGAELSIKDEKKDEQNDNGVAPQSASGGGFVSGSKGSPFLNFTNRAPRSSSPLSGTPFNSSDLPSSPDKPPAKVGQSLEAPAKPTFSFAPQPDAHKSKTPISFTFDKEKEENQPSLSDSSKLIEEERQTSSQPFWATSKRSDALTSSDRRPCESSSEELAQPATSMPTFQPKISTQAAREPKTPQSSNFTSQLQGRSAPNKGASESISPPQQPLRLTMSNKTTGADQGKGLPDLFLELFLVMEEEVEVLKTNLGRCLAFHELLSAPSLEHADRGHLKGAAKWTFGDLTSLQRLCSELRSDIKSLYSNAEESKLQLRKIQGDQLKVETKREEIARFLRARSDPGFHKMVKVRQLGPEHSENQTRLRQGFASLKKSLDDFDSHISRLHDQALDARMGRSTSMQAPSLDTIRRTTRNITRTAEARMMELEEIQLSLEMLGIERYSSSNRRAASIALEESFASSSEDAFSALESLQSALPHVSQNIESEAVRRAVDSARHASDFKQMFLQARSQPLFQRRPTVTDAQRSFEKSDLTMSFARGTIVVDKEKPMKQEPEEPSQQIDDGASAQAPFTAQERKPFGGFALTSPLPASSLPKDMFDLPPEAVPFAPKSSTADPSTGRHHNQKTTSKRSSTAVALPPSATSSSQSLSSSDFFSRPAQGNNVPTGGIATPFTAAAAKASSGESPFASLTQASSFSAQPKFSFTDLSAPDSPKSTAAKSANSSGSEGNASSPPNKSIFPFAGSKPTPSSNFSFSNANPGKSAFGPNAFTTFKGLQQMKPAETEIIAAGSDDVSSDSDKEEEEDADDDDDEWQDDEEDENEEDNEEDHEEAEDEDQDEGEDEDEDEDDEQEELEDDDEGHLAGEEEDDGDSGQDEEGLSAVDEEEEEEAQDGSEVE